MYLRGTPQRDGAVTGEGADCSVRPLSSSTTTSKWTDGFFPFQNRILESECVMDVEAVLWKTSLKEQQLVRRNGRNLEWGGEGRGGMRAAMAKLNNSNFYAACRVASPFQLNLLFICRNLFVVQSWEYTLETRDVTVTPHVVPNTDCHLSSEQFLIPFQQGLCVCNNLRQDPFSDLYLGLGCQLATCSFWCITSRSVLSFRSNWRCAWARFAAVLSTALCEHTTR